jgi:DnaD/phage-associated family protein
MKFSGFPARMEFTPVPNLFFSGLLPQITDIAELKTTLFIIAELYRKRGYPRFVGYNELLDSGLMDALKGQDRTAEEALNSALDMAVERGTLLRVEPEKSAKATTVYLLNDEQGRKAVEKIQNGEIRIGGRKYRQPVRRETGEQPDIFALYEQNIGMLTPMIADELREAEKLYPQEWLREAIREAVGQNKRKWSYISAILKHWAEEGRSDGTYTRHTQQADPDKYIRGKYGHMVRRR